ncbi:hypothetical protein KHA96_01605 [Bacillus sp. FJAT-49711]|uniref:hypothetical protein n=1 Tax=Bacillus sp. FJAT-49711 TaxID=2833585 RepID=UPI001BC9EA19|nr:hypothetical protein [Bacillus sp. FJAT-49711]MBS4217004.1 hypothetical protein [Bacillus sp. FJAT-49711]
MDNEKGERNSTIKIKLNGREQPFSEETAIHDWQSATEEASAAQSEETVEDEEFEWILPNVEKNEVPEYKIINATKDNVGKFPMPKWRKNIKPGISSLFISVFLAIAVGLILGLIIYKMAIQSEDSHVALKEADHSPVTEKEEQNTKNEIYSFTLPDITIPVIQGGLYSTRENAVSAGEDLAEYQLGTTIIEIEGQYYLFIGVAGDLVTAKSWTNKLKEEGLEEVWAKNLTISGKTVELASKEEADRLTDEIYTLHKLAEESANGFVKGVVNEDVINSSEKVITGTFQNEVAKDLHGNLQTAQKHLKSFPTSEATSNELLQAQQALLEFVQIYYSKSN